MVASAVSVAAHMSINGVKPLNFPIVTSIAVMLAVLTNRGKAVCVIAKERLARKAAVAMSNAACKGSAKGCNRLA